jgi:RND superfamily putative drug exporter
MLEGLARFVVKRPRRILLAVLLLAIIGSMAALGLNSRLTANGYDPNNSQYQAASAILQNEFGQGDPNFTVVVTDPRGVNNPAVAAAGTALTKRLAAEHGVTEIASYWTVGRPAELSSHNGQQALIFGIITGSFDNTLKQVQTLAPQYTGKVDGLQVEAGGTALAWQENVSQAAKDVSKAETLVLPVTLLILILIFGSVIAASLPLIVATLTILLTFPFLLALTYLTQASTFMTDVTLFMGLGLSIDYSLLLLTRYREELANGRSRHDAILASVRTAGRTVVFSAVTVAVAFSATLALPFTVFSSLAAAAICIALIAAIMSIIAVPALLAVLGPRVDKLRISIRRRRKATSPAGLAVGNGTAVVENGRWHRLAMFVMRRPIPVAAVVLVVVITIGLPVLGLRLRLPDYEILPPNAQAAQVASQVSNNFDAQELEPIHVVAPNIGDPEGRTAQIVSYARQLSMLPNVAQVDALTGTYAHGQVIASPTFASVAYASKHGTFLNVITTVGAYSPQARTLVNEISSTPAPFSVVVGGMPAESADTFNALYHSLPYALAILAVGMFVLLFLLTGSVLMPIIAMVLSVLTLSATFGALVFIFQDGHLKGLVGNFVVTGAITWTVPITIFAMAFGLAMDYQVFMLSRIREEYARTGQTTTAVAIGLERIGKVVTYAAILMSIVFAVWSTSSLSYMKAIGVGLPLAILMDATLIRGALLPAFMRLTGKWSWWAPSPLARLYPRSGHREQVPEAEPAVTVPDATFIG